MRGLLFKTSHRRAISLGTVAIAAILWCGFVVARVVERQDIKTDEMATARDGLRSELLQQRRGEFFGAYMTKAKEKMNVQYHENAIKAILGGQ